MRKALSYLLCSIIGVFIGLFAFKIYAALIQYDKSAAFYKNTVKEVVTQNVSAKENQSVQKAIDPNVPWYKQIYVDLETLQEENKDVIGWIYFENEDISYPIVQSEDNTEYLDKLYTGESNQAGSIILETTNSPLFTDMHSIVYGHNMKDLSMFGKLRYYRQDTKYLEEHKYFQVFTNSNIYRFQILNWREADKDSSLYRTHFKDFDSFEKFKNKYLITEDTELVETPFNQWVTLSTCLVGDSRLAVTAVCVDAMGRIPK